MRDALLELCGRLVLARPRLILALATALAIGLGWWGAATIRLNANLDDLIARDRPFTAVYQSFLAEFGDLEHIYVVVDGRGDSAAARRAVDEVVERLSGIEGLNGVHAWIDPSEQLRLATRAMTNDELDGFAMAHSGVARVIEARSAEALAREALEAASNLTGSGAGRDELEQAGAGAVFMASALAASADRPAAGLEAFTSGGLERRYLTSDTGRLYFVQVRAHKDFGSLAVIERPLRDVRAALAEIRARHPQVEIGLTGRPVLQADELATSNDDMAKSSVLALALCAALFIWMTASVVRPLLAVGVFLMACGWTYGAAAALVGQLNLLSIVFMLVLVGVGLDYGVHVIARHREFRRDHDLPATIRHVMLTAVRGNITGALTSAVVFLMAWFTHFQGLRELGLIAGVGLVLCLLAMTFVLPAALVLTDRWFVKRDKRQQADRPGALFRTVTGFITHRPALVLTLVALSLAALAAAPGRPRFEKNLLKLQAVGLESVEWENRIREDSSAATWFGASIADSIGDVRRIVEEARATPAIGEVRSVLDLVREDTPERNAARVRLRSALGSGEAPSPARSDPARLAAALQGLTARLDTLALAAAAAARTESATLRSLADSLRPLSTLLTGEGGVALAATMDAEFAHMRTSIVGALRADSLPLRQALPDAVRDEMIAPTGRFLVMLHPRDDVWDYDTMKAFIGEMRRIDPRVTGAPISHFESLGEMQRAFVTMSILAVVAIAFLLWLDFRSLRDVALCFLPLVVGVGWSLEAMGALNVSFNMANFFAVPIMIGLGVDGAVHVLHRYREGGPERFSLGATRRAVLLTALTTIIGFGALLIAHHRGLRSLGVAMALGSTACMLSSLVVLPAALSLLERFRQPDGPPATLRRASALPSDDNADPAPAPAGAGTAA